MERMSFSGLMQVFLHYAGERYSEDRLKVWVCNEGVFGVYDRGNFHKSVKSDKPLTKKIYDYYEDESCLQFVSEDAEEYLLSKIPSVTGLMEAIHYAVLADDSILPVTREELLSGADAEIVAKVLRFAVIRQNKEKTDASPDVEHLLEDVEVPKRTEIFIGRNRELEELSARLDVERQIYVIGVGGVGKSELVQEYARRHQGEYRNTIYLTYQGSVRNTIANIRLRGDALTQVNRNYERNIRLLRSMGEDSLLIMDNLDELPEKSGDLAVLEKLKCRVIVTTRLKAWKTGVFYLDMIDNRQELLELFYSYCPQKWAGEERYVWDLIELVHHHTYAVQLLALTVREGYRTCEELAAYIRREGLDFPNDIFVETNKDGKYDWKPFYQMLDGLFRLQHMNQSTQNGLINFTLMPETGIKKRQFILWSGMGWETQLLVRLGWIQEDEETSKLYIHGLVREMVWDSLKPDLPQYYHTIEAILKTEKQFAQQYRLEDYEDAWDVAACLPQVRKLLMQNTKYFEVYFYLMLLEIYSVRVCFQSVRRLYEAKYVASEVQNEAYQMQMRKEQLDDLAKWLRVRKDACEWVIQEGERWLNCINLHYNELYCEVKEEWEKLLQMQEQCSRELNRRLIGASHGALMIVRPKGRHSKGKTRPSKKR